MNPYILRASPLPYGAAIAALYFCPGTLSVLNLSKPSQYLFPVGVGLLPIAIETMINKHFRSTDPGVFDESVESVASTLVKHLVNVGCERKCLLIIVSIIIGTGPTPTGENVV